MINLLSYNSKKQIKAARLNVMLFRYIIILGLSAAFLTLACTTTYYFISNNKFDPISNSTKSTSLKKQIDSMHLNLSGAKIILDQQVLYSDVLTAIASNLPTGTVLGSLSLNDSSFGTQTVLKINAKSSDVETKIKEGFLKSPQMFSDYTVQSSTANPDKTSIYTYTISIGLIINKGAFQ